VAHNYNVQIARGDRIKISSQAGGGRGPPDERDPHMMKEDLLDGFITPEQAQSVYGLKRQSAPVAFPSSDPKQRPP
jgi:N-methylhydantoinase B/oxoprolinase/acetone carboxylase alpha subunit